MSDSDLRAAFEDYVAARRTALLRIAYLLTGQAADAEDLVQAALIKAMPHWSRIAHDPEAYVRTIMARESVSRWRRRRWREVHTDVVPEAAAQGADIARRTVVLEALAQLSPRQRAVIVLRYYEDLTEAQTADVLGLRLGTVKSHARDALERLRTLLPDEDLALRS
ncbi:SigE family RNA polymerase sigma factor [Nocardioides fonticola]|uniref:SigE family RNA polymerase sigma factor n=1 Tax=Nocardioides fonticola TaxID=450363 RepID=A0ABP7XZS4_9ACTN